MKYSSIHFPFQYGESLEEKSIIETYHYWNRNGIIEKFQVSNIEYLFFEVNKYYGHRCMHAIGLIYAIKLRSLSLAFSF